MRLLPLFLLLLAAAVAAQPVPPTALPLLEIAPSPASQAVGGAGVALPSDAPEAFLHNPALLGLAGEGAAMGGAPAADWRRGIELDGAAARIGADLGPLAVGVGLAQAQMRAPGFALAGDVVVPEDRYRAIGVGASTRGPVRVAAGAALRHVVTSDAPLVFADGVEERALRGVTADLGVALHADLARLAGLGPLGPLAPEAEVTLGYAQTHLGGTVRYSGGAPAPLPRMAALGWSARLGLRAETSSGPLSLLTLQATLQGEHLLAREGGAPEAPFAYASLTGALGPGHALTGRGDGGVTGRRGLRVAALDAVAVSWGALGGGGYADATSWGAEVRLGGLLRAGALAAGRDALAEAGRRVDLRLSRAVAFADTPEAATVTGATLVLRP